MKIGLSLSRCVRDIVEERVNMEDVLVLITRTNFDPTVDEQWADIWQGYQYLNPEWAGLEEDAVKTVVMELWETGKIHQPRKFGAHPRRMGYYWVETVLPSVELEDKPLVKDAWEKFQVLAGLASVEVRERHQ